MPKTAGRAQAIVIGGGPAGAAAAIVLAEAGIEVLVLEAAPGPRAKVGESLPPSVNPILGRLGLEAGIQRAGLPSQANRSRWGTSELIEREFVFGSAGVGWRLDRLRFEAELAATAVRAGVDWRYGHRLIGATAGSPTAAGVYGWSLTVESNPAESNPAESNPAESAARRQRFAADLVIDASGRAARFARLMGVRRVRYDRLVGFVSYSWPGLNSDPDSASDSSLVIEAVPTGWWYSLWLPGSRLAVAYLSDGDLLRESGLTADDGRSNWLAPGSAASDLLEHAPATRDRIQQAGIDAEWSQPQIRPAHSERSTAVTGPGWLAAGEAAICCDPLSSYGITSALGAGIYAGLAANGHLAGRPGALAAHASLIDETFAKYLLMCRERYAAEQRWPAADFWRRRHRGLAGGWEVPLDAVRSPGEG